jgi:putative transposase
MPRKTLIRTDEYFYHVTTRSNHREWFQLPLNVVWEISMESFSLAQNDSPGIVSQFVLMSNHYHLLIRTPNCNLDRFMYIFNKNFSQKIRLQSNLENRMFGSNYKWSLITTPAYFQNVFRYIYQNPLRANIVSKCSDYPFSTKYFYHQGLGLPFKFSPIQYLEKDLAFLDTPLQSEELGRIKKGLHFTKYKELKPRRY